VSLTKRLMEEDDGRGWSSGGDGYVCAEHIEDDALTRWNFEHPCRRDLKASEALDWLADVALHIGSLDPIEIGAGALLGNSGPRPRQCAVDAPGVLMLLLATQAEPQIEHPHPNLGRLIQPRHYIELAATIERGVPWAAGNDCYQGK
jgi:hypothetical protein